MSSCGWERVTRFFHGNAASSSGTKSCKIPAKCLAAGALQLIGAVTAIRTAWNILSFIRLNFLARGADLRKRYAAAGSYAVITGGSDGIGFAMANELAKRGFNIIIIALDQPLLYESADKLRHHGTTVKAIPFDFLSGSYPSLFAQLDEYQIGMLVNNVGMFYKFPMPFATAPLDLDLRMLKLNTESQIRMTKYLLPRFQAAGCGGILNLSSMSSVVAAPYLAVYAGTKGFNMMFAKALEAELREDYPNIDVLILTPHLVVSNMTQGVKAVRPEPGGQLVAASEVAEQTLNKMHLVKETAGHWKHCVIRVLALSWIGRALEPDWLKKVKQAHQEALAENQSP